MRETLLEEGGNHRSAEELASSFRSKADDRVRYIADEESPNSTGQDAS